MSRLHVVINSVTALFCAWCTSHELPFFEAVSVGFIVFELMQTVDRSKNIPAPSRWKFCDMCGQYDLHSNKHFREHGAPVCTVYPE